MGVRETEPTGPGGSVASRPQSWERVAPLRWLPGCPRALTARAASPRGDTGVRWPLTLRAGRMETDFYMFLSNLLLPKSSVAFSHISFAFLSLGAPVTFLPQREFSLTHFDIQKTNGKFCEVWRQISGRYGFYTQIAYLLIPGLRFLRAHQTR